MRFILGLAEAGFFPGVIYYLTIWYPSRSALDPHGVVRVGDPACRRDRQSDFRGDHGSFLGRARACGLAMAVSDRGHPVDAWWASG